MPTALHHEGIYIANFIHWNIGIIPTTLHYCHIHNVKHIHWSIGTMALALRITTIITANGLIRDIDMVDNER